MLDFIPGTEELPRQVGYVEPIPLLQPFFDQVKKKYIEKGKSRLGTKEMGEFAQEVLELAKGKLKDVYSIKHSHQGCSQC